ncbi:MAG TPA: hypothetical protein VFP61_13240 [Acidimicrobiales bacterium]|nr:hypothetical protein [Acidimicrobiales bacterium]
MTRGCTDLDDPVAAARRLADEVLWPAALDVDGAPVVPRHLLDLLADAGLYGVAARAPQAYPAVAEALAGGSLATAFVWVQHHSTVRAVAAAGGDVAQRWLDDLCDGRVRSGIAVAALRRPGPPSMVATAAPGGGVTLDGWAPWVTGWGLIDVVMVAARQGDDLVTCLVDAVEAPGLAVQQVRLAAVDASSTVLVRCGGLTVGADRVVGRVPYSEWRAGDARGLAGNGLLGLGVAARCAHLLDSLALTADVDRLRGLLLAAGPDEVVGVRADIALLALRAATAVVARGGGASVETGSHAQRLLREAMFLVVFGQTAAIRAAQLTRLGVGG